MRRAGSLWHYKIAGEANPRINPRHRIVADQSALAGESLEPRKAQLGMFATFSHHQGPVHCCDHQQLADSTGHFYVGFINQPGIIVSFYHLIICSGH